MSLSELPSDFRRSLGLTPIIVPSAQTLMENTSAAMY